MALIINKLLKTIDAHTCQNAAYAVLEYAISTRDLRRIGFVFGRFDLSRDFLVGSSANEFFYKVILGTRPTSGFVDHPPRTRNPRGNSCGSKWSFSIRHLCLFEQRAQVSIC
jgi:hypothetical protein